MMKKQPAQWLLSIASVGVVGLILTQSYGTAVAETNSSGFAATPEQKLTTRQVAALLDRSHYLNQPLDSKTGAQILDMYLDGLDPNHTLFLQSDVDEFKQKYASDFGMRLKRGDLSAGVDIFERYRKRSNEYFDLASRLLKSNLKLTGNDSIVLDREKLPHFKTKKDQRDYWTKQIKFQLISITLGQEDEKGKEKVFIDNRILPWVKIWFVMTPDHPMRFCLIA